MASKDKAKNKDLEKPKKSKKKLFFFIILLLLSVSIAAGVTFFLYNGKEIYKPIKSQFFEVPEKTEKFIYSKKRDIHLKLKKVNHELTVITEETNRVSELQREYPDQKRITDKAISKYDKLKSNSLKSINKIILKLNDVYVQYSVNPVVGNEILNQEAEKISNELDKIISGLQTKTEVIIKNRPVKLNFIDKIKSKFISK